MKSVYQQRYIDKKKASGLCISCGKNKAYRWSLCRKHYLDKKKRQEEYWEKNKADQRARCADFRRKNPDYSKNWYEQNIKKSK
jgi:hypothetical protein